MSTTPHSTASASSGFTLIEVMVAMMIMAMLAVMAWQGVDGIVKARGFSQARLEQTLRLNTVIAQWEQDLAAIQETTAVPGLTFDGSTARMTRRAERGLQIVTWSLKPAAEGTSGGGTWLRWASPAVVTNGELQDLWMRTQQFQGLETGQLKTLKGINQWQMYCYWGSWSNCQSTGDQQAGQPAGSASAPAPTQRQALPSGVRLVLEFSGGDMNGSLMRDVALGP
ncbi:MAG: prepilin-type N-terminal cleavage/methylation domain-containing protein [Burkholderiales bacterium]|jgi:general secretion pathway protein J|nr:prepilin-type N-terminal cleavage/methylation domain-containing protein [Burkholderiales bacterium]